MQAVILSGGLGNRLKPFTEAIPKPLLPIGEKSILEIQIGRLKTFGFDEIFLATNYKAEYIQNFFGDGSRLGVRVTVSKEHKPLGTCGPLTLLKDRLTAPFVVMNGDILTTIDFGRLYNYAVGVDTDLVVVTKEIVMPFAFGNVFSKDDLIVAIEEKPDHKNEIVAGIYVMKPTIFASIPDDTYFGMDELIKIRLENKVPTVRYLMKEFWLDIGRIEDYDKAQDVYEKHFKD